ncbi:MAG: hypothetical protein JWQ14_3182 [Adhaeribacter sp.]|nr:hypothetical protein [Adhaeribacter sp.]
MPKLSLLLLLLVFSFAPAWAQDSVNTAPATVSPTENLNRLLRERAQMIKEYEFYNAQNSNFWGKKSKKDLLHIIDALKGVINKDSEIIREINTVSMKKQAQITVAKTQVENQKKQIEDQVVGDKQVITDNLYALKTQIGNMENQQKVKQRQMNVLEARLNDSKDKIQELQQLLGLSVLAILGLVVYIFARNGKKKTAKDKR